ncbi:MAG: NUDIX hydrolase [Desulfovibrio sp.]|jgi:isopentenyldiphosphate isomerase|nr:NUDIX hydrolase [Desulfovibrio sp.]
MNASLYPALPQPGDRVEIVDKHNTPIGVMHHADVIRQRLLHRSVAVLLRDAAGRFLLRRRTKSDPAGFDLDFSALVPVPAGQSCETCATDVLREQWGIQARVFQTGLYSPCAENGNCHVAVYEAALRAALAFGLENEPGRYLLLDYDELKGLTVHFNDMLSPYIRVALQNGYVRP